MSERISRSQERAMQQMIKFFETLLRASADGILITDAGQNIIIVNEAYCALLGKPWRDVIETNLFVWLEDFDQDDVLMRWIEVEKCVRTHGICRDTEIRIKTKDGVKHFSVNASLLDRVESEEMGSIISIWRDITQRKHVEDALKESEVRHREIFLHMSSGVTIFEARDDGADFVFKDINVAGEQMSYLKREDLIGMNLLELFPSVREMGLFDVFQRVWRTGIPEHHPVSLYTDKYISKWIETHVYKLPSGEIVAVYEDRTENKQAESALRQSEEALRLAHDDLEKRVQERTAELASVCKILEAETESSRKAEEALRESEERYRIVSELTSDFIYKIAVKPDKTFKLVFLTEGFTRITGFSLGEVERGQNWCRAIHPEDLKGSLEFLRTVLSSEQSNSIEIRMITKKGQTLWMHLFARPEWDQEKNRIVSIVGAGKDITERVLNEKQIKTALKEKEVLLREIHHRVKNNMQIISSLISLQERRVQDERVSTAFNESQNRIRAMALIHEALYQSESLAKVDFANYTSRLVHSLLSAYREASGHIAVNIHVEQVELSIDQAIPCGLILNELISNSLKHAFAKDAEGTIDIDLRSLNGGNIELVVRDNGTGIPADMELRNPKTLGLSLVADLTEAQLRGTLDLCRKEGTRFTIRFKITEESQRI